MRLYLHSVHIAWEMGCKIYSAAWLKSVTLKQKPVELKLMKKHSNVTTAIKRREICLIIGK